MEGRNGFFKLEMRDAGVFLLAYPPENGGKPADIKEAMAYLDARGFKKYDIKELNRAMNTEENVEEVFVGEWQGYYENEAMEVNVSSDKMLAFCRFVPPSNKGKLLTEDDIVEGLTDRNIKVGIQRDEIKKFLENRRYGTDYVLAKGIPPVNGVDARIEYFFNTNPNLKPKRNEDGTVNYRDLNTISRIEKGQMLAKLHKEVKGQPGKNVFGEDIPARQERTMKLEFANNITISEDKTEIYSNVTGHASLVNGKVFVSEIYEVPADVDNATGNIDYNGNVNIKGNVKSGFSVSAKGDIVIEGVVEAAYLSAGGQIIVKRGIHGMNRGHVEAKENIITKFIENATVKAGGFVEAGSIMHSQISAGSEVRVNGKKGFISGGVIRAGNVVEAQTIGSDMGTITKLEVGVDPVVKERYGQVQKEMGQINKELEQIKPILLNFSDKMERKETIPQERMKQIQTLAHEFKEKQLRLGELREENAQLYELIQIGTNAKVKVKGNIYPGVTITISDISMNVKDVRTFSKFIREQGEIVIRPM